MASHLMGGLPILLLVIAVLALASIPLMRAMSRRRGVTAQPVGPVPVPPEEAELVEGRVYACMACGSTRVTLGSISQGAIPGAGDAFALSCRRCGHRGAALEFDDVTAYRQFVKGLNTPDEE